MDPQSRLNALQKYMDFYRSNHMGGPAPYAAPGSQGFGMAQDDGAAAWAQRMAQQDTDPAPDFFGGQGPAYTPPQPVQGIAAQAGFPLAPMDRAQQMQRPESTAAGMGMNFLRNLFARR